MTFASGTTGLPKGTIPSYGNALFKTTPTARACLNRNDDVLLSIAPLHHIAGMLIGVNLPVFTGATTVLMHCFDPRANPQAIDRFDGTHGKAAPGVSIRIIDPDSGRSLTADKVGETAAASPGVFKGYWD